MFFEELFYTLYKIIRERVTSCMFGSECQVVVGGGAGIVS